VGQDVDVAACDCNPSKAVTMTDENTDDMRAAFESWITAPPLEQWISRMGPDNAWPGQYQVYAVQLAWEAWQAATHRRDVSQKCEKVNTLGDGQVSGTAVAVTSEKNAENIHQ
jgi:hypothetical protein